MSLVLGPWHWLRPFLSLASRRSVFEKWSLALASDFLRVLGFKGCVHDSTSDSHTNQQTLWIEHRCSVLSHHNINPWRCTRKPEEKLLISKSGHSNTTTNIKNQAIAGSKSSVCILCSQFFNFEGYISDTLPGNNDAEMGPANSLHAFA